MGEQIGRDVVGSCFTIPAFVWRYRGNPRELTMTNLWPQDSNPRSPGYQAVGRTAFGGGG
jgi:hypothetical protein